VNYKIINRKGTFKVILIHGLFATPGYWLNYLNYFKNCKLAILDIDYNESLNFAGQISDIEILIDKLFNGEADFIFSHSLGTILANGISETKFKRSFEICPVHSSKRISQEYFIDNIMEKSSNFYNYDFVNKKLTDVDLILKEYKQNIKPSKKRIVYYPTNDIYFEYDLKTCYELKIFEGDHFVIDNALIDSFSLINS